MTGAAAAVAPPAPPMLPGFGHISRYWDREQEIYAAKLLPGEYYVTTKPEAIFTVLGSCISACIRDPVFGIGGMNHFMLPASRDGNLGTWKDAGVGAATRFGNFAMEKLVNDILKVGGARQRLEVKIFGGGRILAKMTDVGRYNIDFVRDYLHMEGFKVVSEDTGDVFPRKVMYFPATGRALVKKLRSLHNNAIVEREVDYLQHMGEKPAAGDVTLF